MDTNEEHSIRSIDGRSLLYGNYLEWDNKTKIDGVYRVDCGYRAGWCPECNTEIKQYQVTLLYASDVGVRRSLSPCAWICQECRVALVDEDIAKVGGVNEFLYPLGLLTPDEFFDDEDEDIEKHDPSIFTFYEGHKIIHVIDDDGLPILVPEKLIQRYMENENLEARRAAKRKKNRKLQKQARKRNRKK